MNEASKIRAQVLPYLEGKTVLDLGCGDEKIVPWAVGVDDVSEHARPPAAVDVRARVDPDAKALEPAFLVLGKQEFNTVFSSHTLEHVRSPILDTLRYWLGFVCPGGHLVLYLPDERFYIFDHGNRMVRNPAHRHFLTADTFYWYLEQLKDVVIEEFKMDVGEDRYSFLVVLRKKTPPF